MRYRYLLPFFIWAVGLGATAETGHPLRGVVTSVVAERQLVMVKHEEIPGFMRAMTMAFSVPAEVYPRLTPGTHLIATMYGSRGKWRLEDVQLTDETYQPKPAADSGQAYLLKTTALPAPAGPGASAPNLIRGADGAIYLSWLETDSAATTTLRYARFDPATSVGAMPGRSPKVSTANVDAATHPPQLAVQADGRLTAVWLVAHPRQRRPPPKPGSPRAPKAATGAHPPCSRTKARPPHPSRCNRWPAAACSPSGSTAAPAPPRSSTAGWSAPTVPTA
jgi:hypothetical protein